MGGCKSANTTKTKGRIEERGSAGREWALPGGEKSSVSHEVDRFRYMYHRSIAILKCKDGMVALALAGARRA
jgi:hypothetical protein